MFCDMVCYGIRVAIALLTCIVYVYIENCNAELSGSTKELSGTTRELPRTLVRPFLRPRMARDRIEQFKLSRIKEEILTKLRMTHEPNGSRPDIPQTMYQNAVAKIMGLDEQVQGKQRTKTHILPDSSNVSGYYAAISEIIAFSELGEYD